MLSVVLCLGVMVEDQSRQLISRMRHQHRTKAMTSQLVDSKCKVHVNLKCNSLLSVHRVRGTSHCVRDSMRHSGSVNWQMVRNISFWIKPTNNLSLFLIWFLCVVGSMTCWLLQLPRLSIFFHNCLLFCRSFLRSMCHLITSSPRQLL